MAREFAVKRRNQLVTQTRWPELNQKVSEDYGLEKLCGCCQDWWPLDTEFFSFIPSQGHFRSWCKACEAEATRKRRLGQAVGKVAA